LFAFAVSSLEFSVTSLGVVSVLAFIQKLYYRKKSNALSIYIAAVSAAFSAINFTAFPAEIAFSNN